MKKSIAIVLVLIVLALPASALADVAPPAQPPGSNLQPGEESTQVRMLAEKVVMEISPGGADNLGTAQVTADFTMRNLGDKTETMAARFPISNNDGFSGYPEIKNLQVQVDGRNVRTRRITGEDPYWGGGSVPWAEFDVKFPAGKDVPIRVTYTLDGTGYYPFSAFNYILSTGAGWKDTIGKGEVVVKLPYEATNENVLLAGDTGYWFTSDGAVLEGKEIRWEFKNLEPTWENNLTIEVVAPGQWQKVLKERANVAANPNDGEAWGRLGKLYKELAFLPKELRPDPGGKALYDLSEQAYLKCLELKPNDADWHVGLAELYWFHYNTTQWSDPSNDADLRRAIDLAKKALEINPKNAKAVEMMDIFVAYYPEYVQQTGQGYDYLYLTATPVPPPSETLPPPSPTATSEATAVPIGASVQTAYAIAAAAPTRTPTPLAEVTTQASAPPTQAMPTQAPIPTSTPENRGLEVCGVGFMLPLALVAVLGSRRLQRKR